MHTVIRLISKPRVSYAIAIALVMMMAALNTYSSLSAQRAANARAAVRQRLLDIANERANSAESELVELEKSVPETPRLRAVNQKIVDLKTASKSEESDLHSAITLTNQRFANDIYWNSLFDLISLVIVLGAVFITNRAHSALRNSQDRLKIVIENAQVLLWSIDTSGVFTHFEGSVTTADGHKEEAANLVGVSIFDTYTDNKGIVENTRRVLAGESFVEDVQIGGSYFRTAYAPMFDEQNRVIGAAGLTTDITSQRRADIARDEAIHRERLAQHASRTKSSFLANMSHELRTPINGVIGMTRFVLEGKLSDEQREYGEASLRSAENLLKLVNDILDLSKAEAGKIEIEKTNFSMTELIGDLKKVCVLAGEKKGLRINAEVDLKIPDHLNGDPTRIRQVLTNMIDNSIKFTKEGQVSISVSLLDRKQSACQLYFEVRDTGIGIRDAVLDRIFKPFSQADASTTRKFGGTGLGLSISKHLVTLMGGQVGFSSQEGEGSTFWFTIPLQIAEAAHAKAPSAAPATQVTGPLRVLIAEDNSVNQVIARKMVQKLGHTVTLVENGLRALEALAKEEFDVILMDCMMPELDGYEATRQIRASVELKNPRIPIIALTANAMSGDREKCLDCGMTDYVSKPMTADDLKNAFQRATAVA